MKRLGRGLSIGALVAFLAACGAEGPQGEPGDAPEVTFSEIEAGEECAAGGQAILVDGVETAVLCNGTAGEDGEDGVDGENGADGDSPEVAVTRFDEHEDCDAGGSLVTVTVGDASSETVVCDGGDGDTPTIDVNEVAAAPDGECGLAGGHVFTVTQGGEATGTDTYVCNGLDGVDGDTPIITTSRFVSNAACDAGGVLVTVVLGDDVQEAALCDGEAGADGTNGENGEDGQNGADGASPSISTAPIASDEAGVCGLAGGYAITITSADGESTETLNVCNGADGEAQLPTVTIDENPTECGTAGGVTVTIGSGDPFTVCNGEEGAQGETGADGEPIAVSIGAPADCEYGGYSLTIGENAPVDICNGAPGQDGNDGADGMSPEITVTTLDANPAGVCPDGGVMLTITTASGSTDVPLCGASEPVINGLDIGFCNTQFPSTIEMDAGDSVPVYGQVYVELVTDLDGEMPDTFVAEVGYGDPETSPDDPSWSWSTASQNTGDYGNNYEYQADLTVNDAGIYPYLYRMRLYDEDDYTYCGLNGIVDLTSYDESTDAGVVDVAAVAQTFVGWDFLAADPIERLTASTGTGQARYSDGDDVDPVGSSTFFGSDSSEWSKQGWNDQADFFDTEGNVIDDQYFLFESNFGAYENLTISAALDRSGTGPQRLQIALVYADGSLSFLQNYVDLLGGLNLDLEVNETTFADFDPAGDIVGVRFYPYFAESTSTTTFRIVDIDFLGFQI